MSCRRDNKHCGITARFTGIGKIISFARDVSIGGQWSHVIRLSTLAMGVNEGQIYRCKPISPASIRTLAR